MEKNVLDDLLNTPTDKLNWRFVEAWVKKYLETGLNGQLIIDVQKNHITGVNFRGFASGISSLSLYLGMYDN